MANFMEMLSHEFVRNAIYAGLLASVLCGVVGTFVVVKRLVFISGGISHAAFGGLGVCYFLGLEPRLGAAAAALVVALVLGGGRRRAWVRSHDATVGILWAAGMAVGILFLHKTPGYAPNLMTYLFGDILSVERQDVLWTLALVVLVVVTVAVFFKELVAVSFDEEFAAVQGVPVGAVMTLLMALIALSVVFLIQLVGIVLVIALLTIPPVISRMLVQGFVAVMVLATLIGCVVTLGGLSLSYALDLPSGSTIVLLGTAGLPLAALAQRLLQRRRH
jgi:zinc transport system permease protein